MSNKYENTCNTVGWHVAGFILSCIDFAVHPYAMLCVYNWYLSSILNLGSVNMHHMLGLSIFCAFLRSSFIQKDDISSNLFLSSVIGLSNTLWMLLAAYLFKGFWNV